MVMRDECWKLRMQPIQYRAATSALVAEFFRELICVVIKCPRPSIFVALTPPFPSPPLVSHFERSLMYFNVYQCIH